MQTEEQLIADEPVTEKSVKPSTDYPMDTNPIKIKINVVPSMEKPFYVTHVMRKPSFNEEEARERKSPLITSEAGKIDGKDASSMSIDDEPANVELYDKIILGVIGYGLKPGDKAGEDEVSPDTTVETPKGTKTVRELIPDSHKSTAISGMFTSSFEVEVEEQEFVFALGGSRDWKVRQDIGGKVKREDGTLSPPDYQVFYTFREPSELDRKKYRTKAVQAVNLRDGKTNAITERRSTNLTIMRELFDSLIESVEGATVEGKPIKVSDKNHIDAIPATFKKGTMIRLFNFLEADLSN